MADTIFKIGDIVKLKEYCSGVFPGIEYKIKRSPNGSLEAGQDDNACLCRHNWILIQKKEERQIKTLNSNQIIHI